MREFINIVENANWGNGPASQFVQAFNAWEKENVPSNLNISFDFAKRDENKIYIDYLYVPIEIRYSGWGAKIMRAACLLADQYKITLTLSPVWQDDEDEPDFSLVQWYENFGFEVNYDDDEGGMIRHPE